MEENNAYIIYRENEKLTQINSGITEELQSEYDVKTKVFPRGTAEEDIEEWAANQDLSSYDLILSDKTFNRAAGVEIDNPEIYSLDKIYNESSSKAIETVQDKEKEDAVQELREESSVEYNEEEEFFGLDPDRCLERFVEGNAETIDSLRESPGKVYIAYPNLLDHVSYEGLKTKAREFAEEKGYEWEGTFLDQKGTEIANEGLKSIAQELASELEGRGYDTEVVGEFLTFDEMEEDSWFLVDGHCADQYANQHSEESGKEYRSDEREGSKARLMIDALIPSAVGLEMWDYNDDPKDLKQDRQEEFEENLENAAAERVSTLMDKEARKGEYGKKYRMDISQE